MDEPKETPEVFTRDAPRTHTHTVGLLETCQT